MPLLRKEDLRLMAHATKTPPSSADRWFYCTASVLLILQLMRNGELKESDLERDEGVTEDEVLEFGGYDDVVLGNSISDSFSAEGTVLHEVRASCLEFNLDPMNFVGLEMSADGHSFLIDDDKADRLVAGIDWIREHTRAPYVETRVDLSEWLPEQFGTCDTFWLKPVRGKRDIFDLYVSDYKNGIGRPVDAEGNKQLRIYALGAWVFLGKPNIRKIIINIDQPRVGGMKYDEFDFQELLEFGEELKRIWERIESGNVEFVPTIKGCQFCPVRKTDAGCAAYNRWLLLMCGTAFLDPSEPYPKFKDPEQITAAQRYYIVRHAAALKSWLEKLYEASLRAAMAGNPDPGSKAIEGNGGKRYFTNEERAQRIMKHALGDQAFKPRELIGFTELDRLMKPGRKKDGFPRHYALLEKLAARPKGKPKLVSADHPKPALETVSTDDFEDLPEKGSVRRVEISTDDFADL